ncbi:unnamed protein product [Moneuplotes crassus]|uniref:Uncharacterized protein n=1 Tax=Euplotes crassus TaxID=5936 RepID=A0AAD1UHJ3_EUPCR|nr:unnamed protein product [Moneuplotes crassus]
MSSTPLTQTSCVSCNTAARPSCKKTCLISLVLQSTLKSTRAGPTTPLISRTDSEAERLSRSMATSCSSNWLFRLKVLGLKTNSANWLHQCQLRNEEFAGKTNTPVKLLASTKICALCSVCVVNQSTSSTSESLCSKAMPTSLLLKLSKQKSCTLRHWTRGSKSVVGGNKVPADDQTGETEAKFYRMAEVKDLDYMRKSGIPLPAPDVKYIFKDLKWDKLLWGDTSLKIRDSLKVENINGINPTRLKVTMKRKIGRCYINTKNSTYVIFNA